MYIYNGLKFDIDTQQTINDTQYPRGWFYDADNRAAFGIVEVSDPIWPNEDIFVVKENPDGSLTSTPRTPEDIAARTANALAEFQAGIVQQTQQRLDAFAQTRNYDNILSAATYVSSGVPKFAAEGQYAVTVRDQTWAALYAFMEEVLADTRPMPTSFTDIEPSLPELMWPL